MSRSPEWFVGVDSPFVAALRRFAPERLTGLVDPDETIAFAYPSQDAPVMAIDVWNVPARKRATGCAGLQVLWQNGALGGYWAADDYLFDDFDERDPESLVVRGLPLTDAEAANFALDWLARQLTRPVELREWDQYGVSVARAWVLADTDVEIATEGPRRNRRGAPSQSEVIRGEWVR